MTAAITRKTEILPQQGTSGELTRVMLDAQGAGGHLVRKLVDVAADAACAGTAGPGGELWFVIAGSAQLEANGSQVRLGPQSGLRLPGGARYRLIPAGRETVQLDVVSLPPLFNAGEGFGGEPGVVDLADCAVETTGDRRFRVLFGPGRGCEAATQFVGEIPPGRAPEHSHPYDEVVLVLAGQGVVHLGPAEQPLAAGSCVHLPPGQPHCLENTGRETLVVLGVFHPGGSPAQKKTESG
jgi:mannose-6-phosphate isomerase-like protein (cupin superfamily)